MSAPDTRDETLERLMKGLIVRRISLGHGRKLRAMTWQHVSASRLDARERGALSKEEG